MRLIVLSNPNLLTQTRTLLLKAELISEAPTARAAQEIRKAATKTETIEPKGTGESVYDRIMRALNKWVTRYEGGGKPVVSTDREFLLKRMSGILVIANATKKDKPQKDLKTLLQVAQVQIAETKTRPPSPPQEWREWAQYVFDTKGDLTLEALAAREKLTHRPGGGLPLLKRAIGFIEARNRRMGLTPKTGSPPTAQQLVRRARNQRYRDNAA